MAVISAPGARTVGGQVGRGLGIGLGAVAVLVLGGVAVAYGAQPASEAWARVAGDPGVTLAEGVTLTDAPARSVQLTIGHVDIGSAEVAAAFGGPAREVTTVEEASKVLGGEVSDQLLAFKRYFVVPSGIVETARAVQPGAIGAVVLRTAPTATASVVAASAEDRARFVRQMEAAVGMTSGADPALDVQVTETVRSSGDIEVTTRPLLAGSLCEGCGYARSTSVFSSDGTLEQAVTWAQSVEDVAPVQTITASEAFDLLRHHRADALVGGGGPVVRAVLTPAVIQPGLSVPASWVFYDAEGETVGQVSAQPGRDVVMDDAAPAEVTVG